MTFSLSMPDRESSLFCAAGTKTADGQFHEDRDKVKINKYFYFHCKLIALTQTVLYMLGKTIMQTEFVVNTCVTAPISIIDTFGSYGVIEKNYYLNCFPRELSQTSAGMVM